MLSIITAAAMAATLASADISTAVHAERLRHRAPAIVVGTLDDGGKISVEAFGNADAATHFEIGSISKQFTAVAILQLKERGKLSLDDRLSKYLPQFASAASVTVRELLNQTSGIPDSFEGVDYMAINRVPRYTFQMLLDRVKHRPLHFKPGTQWEYSNTNYQLLGRIVELASGEGWESYVRSKLFAPVGMASSAFLDDESTLPDMATGYRIIGSDAVPSPRFHGWEDAAIADGGIVSNAADLLRWEQALFGGKLLSDADLAEMTTPATLPDGSSSGYGYGISVEQLHGERVLSHNGGMLGFTSYCAFDPKMRRAIVILENVAGASPWIAGRTILASTIPVSVTPTTAGPPAVTLLVKQYWQGLADGNLDRSRLAPQLNAKITPSIVSTARAQLAELGAVLEWNYKGMKTCAQASTCYAYVASTSVGIDVYVQVGLDANGSVTALLVGTVPPPGYKQ